MNIRSDFAKSEVVRPGDEAWRPSSMPGVERMMLDRLGDEVARATSIVRYAPNASFSTHVHGGGEEFLVLEGLFEDEHGSYPKGCWIRSPHHSQHAPFTGPLGALIYVKTGCVPDGQRTS